MKEAVMKKHLLLISLLSLISLVSFAQQHLSLYNMQHIPQVVYANPATNPLGRVNIAIPGLGSDYTRFGKSNFATQGVTVLNSNGHKTLDVDKFINGLQDQNAVFAAGDFEIAHIGFTVKKNYFFFNATDRINSEFVFPKELAWIITEVFNSTSFRGLKVEDVQLQYNHFREYGFGMNRKINDKLSLGVRLKLFNGIGNFQTNNTGLLINAQDNEIIDGIVNVDIRTSGIENYLEVLNDPSIIYNPTNNWGYAIDLGAEYSFNNKMKAGFSATDVLATITWKDNVKNYNAENVIVDFKTIDWSEVTNIISDSGVFNGFYDSILNNTEASEIKRSYQTSMPTKILGSFTYAITPKIDATLLGQFAFTNNYFQEYIRIGIQGRIKRFFNYMVSYSIADDRESSKNLGLGFAINAGPLQIHALTDNIFDPLLLQSDYNPSLRFGLNLTFGRDFQ